MEKPPVTITHVTAAEIGAWVEEWKAAHPGHDESNYVDAFRDETGELVEDEAFFDASALFALHASGDRHG